MTLQKSYHIVNLLSDSIGLNTRDKLSEVKRTKLCQEGLEVKGCVWGQD